MFGAAALARLQSQNVFLVGCGALGCEYIKAFALMGLGTKGGSVHMTDDDRIELSNLSRQFLFRRRHVGHSKVRRETHNHMQLHLDRGWFCVLLASAGRRELTVSVIDRFALFACDFPCLCSS